MGLLRYREYYEENLGLICVVAKSLVLNLLFDPFVTRIV